MATPRYIVGIDLGTTNCVLAYVDTTTDNAAIQVLAIPQLVKAGTVRAQPRLPSFLYLPSEGEFPAGSLELPWGTPPRLVGEFARSRGAEVPARVVTSAKSWLTVTNADPNGPILPWGAPDDVPRLSPVDAQAAYLAHLRAAWDAAMPAETARERTRFRLRACRDVQLIFLTQMFRTDTLVVASISMPNIPG